MKIDTFTIIVGTTACNAKCDFCIAKMTPTCNLNAAKSINLRNFDIACRYAKQSGVSTVLLTGKGEPTLFPDEIDTYMNFLDEKKLFPFIELQTNGLVFRGNKTDEVLNSWYHKGMTTISLSIIHHDLDKNAAQMYPKETFDYWEVIDKLHGLGFSVRVNCTMYNGAVDNIDDVLILIEKCREKKVEQITLRKVTTPDDDDSKNMSVTQWVKDHNVDSLETELDEYFYDDKNSNILLKLPHGATIYDYNGQNVCVNNCLTSSTNPDQIRQLIFFPDGHLRFDWKYEGAIIL